MGVTSSICVLTQSRCMCSSRDYAALHWIFTARGIHTRRYSHGLPAVGSVVVSLVCVWQLHATVVLPMWTPLPLFSESYASRPASLVTLLLRQSVLIVVCLHASLAHHQISFL